MLKKPTRYHTCFSITSEIGRVTEKIASAGFDRHERNLFSDKKSVEEIYKIQCRFVFTEQRCFSIINKVWLKTETPRFGRAVTMTDRRPGYRRRLRSRSGVRELQAS